MKLLNKLKHQEPKAITFYWSDKGKKNFSNLLSVLSENRGKVDVFFEGDNFTVMTYKDGCLDGQRSGPFDVLIRDSIKDVMAEMRAETKEDLLDALAHEDELISMSHSNPDDDDFEDCLAGY